MIQTCAASSHTRRCLLRFWTLIRASRLERVNHLYSGCVSTTFLGRRASFSLCGWAHLLGCLYEALDLLLKFSSSSTLSTLPFSSLSEGHLLTGPGGLCPPRPGPPATPRARWHLRIPALTNPSASLSLGEISALKLVFGGHCSPLNGNIFEERVLSTNAHKYNGYGSCSVSFSTLCIVNFYIHTPSWSHLFSGITYRLGVINVYIYIQV